MATYNHLGYNKDFLVKPLPLPKIKKSLLAPLIKPPGNEIKYTHYSVVVNTKRLLPLMSAVNIRGEDFKNITRTGNEPWDFSDQIKEQYQIDDRFYGADDSTFDRGHLVRRLDPCWGTKAVAKKAEHETFRWVNCTPQHRKLNRNGGVWFELEQHVLENGVKDKISDISVFAGPILASTDQFFIKPYLEKDVAIPAAFWKVIVWRKQDGNLYAVGFMMSQLDFIKSKLKKNRRSNSTGEDRFIG
ncbi:MAG TPA: DNA/RNA non-specific endonuclease [Ohtaekwangia sp.]